MESKEYYVYLHEFANGRIYIGKGKGDRAVDFRTRSEFWKRSYCKYGDPSVTILDSGLDEDVAFELEEFCIKVCLESGYALGDSLINFTLGGEGASGHAHNEDTKAYIGKCAKEMWKDSKQRAKIVKNAKKFWASEEGRSKKSAATKKMWESEGYRNKKTEQIKEMWKQTEHIEKMSKRMIGSNNPSARRANIYRYPSGELIAANVVSAEWARENGYSRPKLQTTAKADRSKPSTAGNPHHHKKVYMEYTDGE